MSEWGQKRGKGILEVYCSNDYIHFMDSMQLIFLDSVGLDTEPGTGDGDVAEDDDVFW